MHLDSGLSLSIKSYDKKKKKQLDRKRENTDESNIFKENIIKEIF